MKTNTYDSAFRTLCTLTLTKVATLFKISFIVGSQAAMLSGASMVLPLIGLFSGIAGSTLICATSLTLRYLIFGISSLSVLAFYIPGWCASLYMASSHWLIRVGLSLFCMVAFIAHPVGGSAWLYTMYWLIPVAIYVSNRTHIAYQALGATCTAHAVGSVIWLYTVPMTAEAWLGLMPIVAIERLCYAAGIVVAYHAILALSSVTKKTYRSAFYRIS